MFLSARRTCAVLLAQKPVIASQRPMSPVVEIRICRFVRSVSFHRFVGADAYIGPPRRGTCDDP